MTILLVQNIETDFIEVFKNISSIQRYFKGKGTNLTFQILAKIQFEIDKPVIKKKVWIITRKEVLNK